MISLTAYRNYWIGVSSRVTGIRSTICVTVDEDFSKHLSDLTSTTLPVLFVIVPEAHGEGMDVDSYDEECDGIVLLGDKYDPQRREAAVGVLERLQPLIEELKATLLEDTTAGCPVMGDITPRSLHTSPVSNMYNNFAGWMLVFKFHAR